VIETEVSDEKAEKYLSLKNSSFHMRKILAGEVPNKQAVNPKNGKPLTRKQRRRLERVHVNREAKKRRKEAAKQGSLSQWKERSAGKYPWLKPNGRVDYHLYIVSVEWKLKRLEALRHYGEACDQCGDKNNLQVHHIHYKNLGREKLEDLQILCKGCHFALHEEKGEHTTPSTNKFIEMARSF
jgi:5-methylcytosine-specific restriction endonuclease McrA